MKISVDAEYLEELEKKAKRHDFFEGYIKGIEVAFAFAEELVKDIGNRKTEPQTDLLVTEYPQDGEVNLIGRGKTEAVVMAYDVYKELTEPQRNMAEDIVESFGFKGESYRQAKAKTEPQIFICPIQDDYEALIEDEPQTEKG